MELSTSVVENNIIVIEVKGEVDAHTAKNLNETLKDLLAQGYRRITIDVSQMTYISSVGLRAILFAHQKATQSGGEVRLSGPSAEARRIFEIAGLFELLQISDTLQDTMEGWK